MNLETVPVRIPADLIRRAVAVLPDVFSSSALGTCGVRASDTMAVRALLARAIEDAEAKRRGAR